MTFLIIAEILQMLSYCLKTITAVNSSFVLLAEGWEEDARIPEFILGIEETG